MPSLSRRDFVAVAAAQTALILSGCDRDPNGPAALPPAADTLASHPRTPTEDTSTGFHPLGLATGRDGFFYVPPTYVRSRAAPLLVLLHGTGSSGDDFKSLPIPTLADGPGAIVLCPDSRAGTWDLSLGGFGPDVRFIDDALALVFRRCNIDPAWIAFGGFSNGASYALSLGVNNGDLFSALIAFSPGFFTPPSGRRGKPGVYVSHGTQDPLLTNATSPQIVPRLRAEGYAVTYRLFDGGHELPFEVADEALRWFLSPGSVVI